MNRTDNNRSLNPLPTEQHGPALRDLALAAGNVLLPYLVAALLVVGFQ